MLNLSDTHVIIDTSEYQSFRKLEMSRTNLVFKRWLLFLLAILLSIMFLPWTQNIKAKGMITTLSPDQRPQTIQATIGGRIEKWFVREGEFVKKGDTIVYLSEIKTDYFDPDLIQRTGAQVEAKKGSVDSYSSKVKALDSQILAMRSELTFKKDQLLNKIEQTKLKAEAEKNELEAAVIDVQTETKQLARTEELYKKGLTPLTSLENKRLKLQQTNAKKIAQIINTSQLFRR
jgi:adhesin transport system membrane fusion protein